LCEVFTQLGDRTTRYEPLLLELFPTPATRPRQREVLIELYRKGKIADACRAFRKIYLEVIDQIIDHLNKESLLMRQVFTGVCIEEQSNDLPRPVDPNRTLHKSVHSGNLGCETP
jgi:hypothetical protein